MVSLHDCQLIEKSTLSGIASAIRSKTGKSAPILVENMANEIANIRGVSTVEGSYTLVIGGTFSYMYGDSPDITVHHPACVSYVDDGDKIVFTANSVGTGSVTIKSDSSTVLAEFDVTVVAGTK